MCRDFSNISVRTAVMRRLGAWMQLYLKLDACARCGRSAPYILLVSDIFLDVCGCCRSVRLARRLTPLTKLFSGLYQPAIWIKALWFEGLCLIQPKEGRIAAPRVYGAAPYQNYRSLEV